MMVSIMERNADVASAHKGEARNQDQAREARIISAAERSTPPVCLVLGTIAGAVLIVILVLSAIAWIDQIPILFR